MVPSRTGERCAAPNAASGRPASSTRATSMTPPPSAAAASAPPARCGSRPTSASRRPGWSSSSATASRQEFDRDKLVSGLRKALTRRPVPDGAAEAAADAIEAELRSAGVTEVPSSRVGALAMEQLRGDRPDRLHPVRQRLPELRGPRGAQARGRHPVRGARDTIAIDVRDPERPHVSVLSDRDIRAALEAGSVRIDPYDPHDLQPSSVDLHLDRSFRVFRNNRYPYIDVRAAAAGPDRAADRSRRTSRSSSTRASSCSARRSNGSSCRTISSRGSRASHRLGGSGCSSTRRPGYVDPGWKGNLTLELSNVANLPIALYYGMRIGQISFFKMSSPGRAAVRLARARVEVPGPVGADRVGVPPRLRGRPHDRGAHPRQ